MQLLAGTALTVRTAADAFLRSLDNANTFRSHGIGVGKTAQRFGEGRPLVSVADDEIADDEIADDEIADDEIGEPLELL